MKNVFPAWHVILHTFSFKHIEFEKISFIKGNSCRTWGNLYWLQFFTKDSNRLFCVLVILNCNLIYLKYIENINKIVDAYIYLNFIRSIACRKEFLFFSEFFDIFYKNVLSRQKVEEIFILKNKFFHYHLKLVK